MIYVFSLCYNNPAMMQKSLERFIETSGFVEGSYRLVLVNQHYPLRYEKSFFDLWESRGAKILDPGENLGLQRGFNYALQRLGIKDADVVIGYDPDVFPVTRGWGPAMVSALNFPNAAWISLWTPHTERELNSRGFEIHHWEDGTIPGGITLIETKAPCLNSVCAWPGWFLNRSKGLHDGNPLYGGLEVAMWNRLQTQGKKWLFLRFYKEELAHQELVDPEYRDWKWKTTHGGEKQIQFSEWLKAKK